MTRFVTLIVSLSLLLLAPSVGFAQRTTSTRTAETTQTRTTAPTRGTLKDGRSFVVKRGKLLINNKLASAGTYTLPDGRLMLWDGNRIQVRSAEANPTPHP